MIAQSTLEFRHQGHELLPVNLHLSLGDTDISGKDPGTFVFAKDALWASVDQRDVGVVSIKNIIVGDSFLLRFTGAKVDPAFSIGFARSFSQYGVVREEEPPEPSSVLDLNISIFLQQVGGGGAWTGEAEVWWSVVPSSEVLGWVERVHGSDCRWAASTGDGGLSLVNHAEGGEASDEREFHVLNK